MKDIKSKIFVLLWIIALVVGEQFLLSGAVVIGIANPFVTILIYLIGFAPLLIVLSKYEIFQKFKFEKKIFIVNLTIILLALGTLFLTSLAGQGIIAALKLNQEIANQTEILNLFGQSNFLMMGFALIIAGVYEEIGFRWLIFEKAFKDRPKVAFAVSAVLFALAHVISGTVLDLSAWITYGLMSIVLTGLYYWKRNIYINISVHMLWNTIGFAMVLLSM